MKKCGNKYVMVSLFSGVSLCRPMSAGQMCDEIMTQWLRGYRGLPGMSIMVVDGGKTSPLNEYSFSCLLDAASKTLKEHLLRTYLVNGRKKEEMKYYLCDNADGTLLTAPMDGFDLAMVLNALTAKGYTPGRHSIRVIRATGEDAPAGDENLAEILQGLADFAKLVREYASSCCFGKQ